MKMKQTRALYTKNKTVIRMLFINYSFSMIYKVLTLQHKNNVHRNVFLHWYIASWQLLIRPTKN